MKIRCGFDISYHCPVTTPMLLQLNVHPSRERDLVTQQMLRTTPYVPVRTILDGFGNRMTRIIAPPGDILLSSDFIIEDSGLADDVA